MNCVMLNPHLRLLDPPECPRSDALQRGVIKTALFPTFQPYSCAAEFPGFVQKCTILSVPLFPIPPVDS